MKNLRIKSAFTLAEVLITLGIIGIVAALTIPSLMANYQKTQYVVELKKAYSEITQAMKLMANDAGCPDNLSCVDAFNIASGVGNANGVGNTFKKYFKLAKDCGSMYVETDENTKCLPDSYGRFYDGVGNRYNMNSDYYGYYTFITADGFSIAIYGLGCVHNVLATNLNLSQTCGDVVMDVNGSKGPNNMGRDIFKFSITNGKGPAIYPTGGADDSDMMMGSQYWKDTGSCTESNPNGNKCAARIIDEGWKMNY